jgi:CxxC motif-containing protein (DUF1111 family)
MKSSYAGWFLVVALVALTPVCLRLMIWRSRTPQPIDESMAEAGKTLFLHEWKPNDPLCNGGDGLGPVYNAASCVACHSKGGVGGSGGLTQNVTGFTIHLTETATQDGVVHAHATAAKFEETLRQVDPRLPAVSRPKLSTLVVLPNTPEASQRSAGPKRNKLALEQAEMMTARGRRRNEDQPLAFPKNVHVSQRNTPALFGAKLIDDIPDRVIIANERKERLKWGVASPDNENAPVGRALRLADGRVGRFGWKAQISSLGEFVQAACANELGLGNPNHPQPQPLGVPGYRVPGLDLTLDQCNQLTAFVASLPRPVERESAAAVHGGKVFERVGCADCHTPSLGDVTGIYSDLLLHRMGRDLVGGGSYGQPPVEMPDFPSGEGPDPSEWRTPPLWGVADSAPYLHDGRAETLQEAIAMHGGQGMRSAKQFFSLQTPEQDALVDFLRSLRAP